MPNENQDPNQFINFIKEYKWRIIGFIAMLILAVLFLIGVGLGYIKDCTQQFLNFLNRIS